MLLSELMDAAFCDEMRVISVFSFFTFCGFFTFCLAATSNSNAKSGPYTIELVSVKKCAKPNAPHPKEPIFSAFVKQNEQNKNVFYGNFTIIRDTSNIKMTVQDFYSEAGKWQMTFYMKNLSCRSHFVSDVLDDFGVLYSKKTCLVVKATYPLEADLDRLDHMWAAAREYGRIRRRVEAADRAGLVFCLEMEADVRPQK